MCEVMCDECGSITEADLEIQIREIHAMLTELTSFLEPLKGLAAGMTGMRGSVVKAGMNPNARAAMNRIEELSR